MNRPTWKQLTKNQKASAFAMNQDGFEQSGLSKTDEWNSFQECFDDKEWERVWLNLLEQTEQIVTGKM